MTMKFDFKGVISALPTPFINGKVDIKSLEKLIHYQLKNGIQGFVVNGTTAESPTLHWNEVVEIFKAVKNISGDKVPIIIGTGSNSTAQTIETTKKAAELGADAVLVVVPYYNKPPQRGLVQHFNSVANASAAPVILYNVPGRTITSLAADSIIELSKNKNIIGIKEASGDIDFNKKLFPAVPENFIKLSGDDDTYNSFLKIGGHGVISVMSNIITSACVRWTKNAEDQKWQDLEKDFLRHKKLISGLFIEANPIALKWMLYKMGLFESAEMRLPLMPLAPEYHELVTPLLKELELIS